MIRYTSTSLSNTLHPSHSLDVKGNKNRQQNTTTKLKYISRTVWILSVVSLLTDTASEMLYPIMPIYLKTIGFSVILIGILEGAAKATAGLSKGYFGKLSDISGRRVPLVQIGFAFSTISKSMMAIFIYPLWVFFCTNH